MKELIIMRHAKSDWNDASLTDIERTLNERGKKAAPLIAKELIRKNILPEKIFASTAIRAKETAKLVAKEFGIGLREINYDMQFYYGFRDDYFLFIKHLPEDINRAMIIGHNPNIESIIAYLAKNKEKYRNMPTAAATYIQFDVDKWSEIFPSSGLIHFTLIPKEL